jgi:hypothetical protein
VTSAAETAERCTAWVVEEVEWDGAERWDALALFRAHLEPDGNAADDLLPLAEALTWARQRTPRVLVRVCDEQHNYSGGPTRLFSYGQPLPVWDEARNDSLVRRTLPWRAASSPR